MGLKSAIESAGYGKGKLKEFAAKAGMSYQTLWRVVEKGEAPSRATVAKLAIALGLTRDGIETLIAGSDDCPVAVPPVNYQIPVQAIVVAGPASEAVEIPEVPVGWEPTSHPPQDGLRALEIHGDSMEPVLWHGDRVVVDHRESAQDGDIVLAEYRATPEDPPELTVKMFTRRPDGFWIEPLNPASRFKPQPYDARVWRISAVVVKIIARHVRGRFRFLSPGPAKP